MSRRPVVSPMSSCSVFSNSPPSMRRLAFRMYQTGRPVNLCSLLAMATRCVLRQAGARLQRRRVFAHRETFDRLHERGEIVRLLAGKLVVIPRRRRIGRQRDLVGQVDAGIVFGPVDRQIEVQDLRQQDHAVEVDVVLGLEIVDENGRARRAVAFAEEIFRRVEAVVLGEEFLDESRERVAVGIDAVERLLLVLAGDAAEAGARRVDEDEIAGIEQRLIVVDDLVGRGGVVACPRR